MLFRDMPNQTGNEFHYRDGFHNKFVVLMSVVMKSNIFTIVFINEGSGNDGAAKISADVFGNNLRITSEKRSVFQKKVSRHFNSPAPQSLRGGVVFSLRFIHNDLMSNVLQDIFKDHYEEIFILSIPVLQSLKMLTA